MSQHQIVKIAWIHLLEGTILSTLSRAKDKFYIPGGKPEPGESEAETLIREIKEELSVELIPQSLRFWGEYIAQADGHPQGLSVTMRCYFAEYCGKLQAASEIERFVWLSYRDRARVSAVDQLIFDALKAEKRLKD